MSAAGAPGVSGGAFFWNALLFTRALRAAGLRTDLGAAIDYSRALTLIDIGEREQVHAAGQALFVRRRDELPVYDEVFDALLAALRAGHRAARPGPASALGRERRRRRAHGASCDEAEETEARGPGRGG